MPTRLLYEKICVSVTLAGLSAEEERLFYRLMVQCDDYGRFHAEPTVLLGRCFSAHVGQIDVEQVRMWRDRLVEAGLIEVYGNDGREYLAVTTWGIYQRQRSSKPKFPPPPGGAESCSGSPQVAANGSKEPLVRAPAAPAEEAGGRGPKAGSRGPVAGGRGASPQLAAAEPPQASPATSADVRHDEIPVPAAVAGFHAVLVGTRGYAPSADLLEQITERYSSLDLREEALKMRSWLADPERNRRQRSATEKFILGWLKRGSSDPPSGPTPPNRTQHANGRSDSIYGPIVTVEGMRT